MVRTESTILGFEKFQLYLPSELNHAVLALHAAIAFRIALEDMIPTFEEELHQTSAPVLGCMIGVPFLLRGPRVLQALALVGIHALERGASPLAAAAADHEIVSRPRHPVPQFALRHEAETLRRRRVVDIVPEYDVRHLGQSHFEVSALPDLLLVRRTGGEVVDKDLWCSCRQCRTVE